MDECGIAGLGLHLQVGHLKFELEKNCDTLWEERNFIMNTTNVRDIYVPGFSASHAWTYFWCDERSRDARSFLSITHGIVLYFSKNPVSPYIYSEATLRT